MGGQDTVQFQLEYCKLKQTTSIYSGVQPHHNYTKQLIKGKSKQTHLHVTGAKCRRLCLTKSQLAFILQLIGSVCGV